MRSSWNFSTAIFEIWVLVLTKPGWANETPTTSLRVPREFNDYHHHQVQHQQQHHHIHHHENHHYSVAASTSRDFESSSGSSGSPHHHHHQSRYHQQPHSSSSYYSSNSDSNNHYYSHHIGSNRHLESALASSSLLYSPHRCYVCLPPNKNSREAQQILAIFANELRPLIPDCSAFDPYVDAGRFEFDCPPKFGGCILRIHGTNISRACSKWRVNDCKKANSVEFCYCTTPLCNDKKPEPPVIPPVHHGNSGNSGRRGSHSRTGDGNIRSKSSIRGTEEQGVNSQGIRTRVSEDDEDILHPDGEDDDDDTGSGTGDSDQEDTEQHQHSHSYIDPYTSTMDPTIFHEESFAVAVEDPNPHTKIGISMTASTSGGSSISKSTSSSVVAILGGSFWWWGWSPSSLSLSSFSLPPPPGSTQPCLRCGNKIPCSQDSVNRIISGRSRKTRDIFHLFLVHLHQQLFVRLFGGEQVVEDHQNLEPTSPSSSTNITDDRSISLHHYRHHHHYHHHSFFQGGSQSQLVNQHEQEEGGCRNNVDAPEATTTVSSLCLNSQLYFIISLLVVLQVLLS